MLRHCHCCLLTACSVTTALWNVHWQSCLVLLVRVIWCSLLGYLLRVLLALLIVVTILMLILLRVTRGLMGDCSLVLLRHRVLLSVKEFKVLPLDLLFAYLSATDIVPAHHQLLG